MTDNRRLFVGELAKLSGVKPDTIRFYERTGLLPKPARTASAYRVYDHAALELVRFIRKAQSLGFALAEIKRILRLRGRGRETCKCVIAIAEATLAETRSKLKDLQRFEEMLSRNLRRWKKQPKARR
jgi:DNA-binding transcriptional MerR regulator